MADLHELTVRQLSAALAAGEVGSVEATRACLERADATAHLGAYLYLDREGALRAAQAADARRRAHEVLGPLDGVPVAVKDNILTQGLPTTCASKILEGFVAPYDATVVQRLCDAGAVLLGKLNMDEFAMGSSCEHSAFGGVKNPWDPSRVPGGSSGGSAAAVAAGSAFAALGTDTGGSIRQPAAFCGVVGMKPTYGRVSRYGVIAFASSLDQVGPLCKDVGDAAQVLQVIAGFDPRDATSAQEVVGDFNAALGDAAERGLAGVRLGLPKEYFAGDIDPEVRRAVQAAAEACAKLGAELVDVSLPSVDYAIACYYLIADAEASSNLARYDGVRYGLRKDGADLIDMYVQTRSAGFGDEVKRRIMLGTYALSAGYYDAYYGKAQKARTLVRRELDTAFERCDLLLTPTTPSPAFALGSRADDPLQMYLADLFTVSCNLAGLPGISLPCGITQSGLPIGMQLLAPVFCEARLFKVAAAYEAAHDWHRRRPPL